jgi:hypothetical protein
VNQGEANERSGLSREQILEALGSLSDELGKRGVKGEICLFGGAVMVIAFNARLSTRDVDAIFQPSQLVRELAADIAESRGLSATWLNDGVKGFVSEQPPVTSAGLPQFANLHVTMPAEEYILAMKCIAGRTGEGATDLPDIIFLIRKLQLKTPQQVLDIVSKYYGRSGVPVKTQYLVEGLFEEGEA